MDARLNAGGIDSVRVTLLLLLYYYCYYYYYIIIVIIIIVIMSPPNHLYMCDAVKNWLYRYILLISDIDSDNQTTAQSDMYA